LSSLIPSPLPQSPSISVFSFSFFFFNFSFPSYFLQIFSLFFLPNKHRRLHHPILVVPLATVLCQPDLSPSPFYPKLICSNLAWFYLDLAPICQDLPHAPLTCHITVFLGQTDTLFVLLPPCMSLTCHPVAIPYHRCCCFLVFSLCYVVYFYKT